MDDDALVQQLLRTISSRLLGGFTGRGWPALDEIQVTSNSAWHSGGPDVRFTFLMTDFNGDHVCGGDGRPERYTLSITMGADQHRAFLNMMQGFVRSRGLVDFAGLNRIVTDALVREVLRAAEQAEGPRLTERLRAYAANGSGARVPQMPRVVEADREAAARWLFASRAPGRDGSLRVPPISSAPVRFEDGATPTGAQAQTMAYHHGVRVVEDEPARHPRLSDQIVPETFAPYMIDYASHLEYGTRTQPRRDGNFSMEALRRAFNALVRNGGDRDLPPGVRHLSDLARGLMGPTPEANERAETLLLESLTPEQRESYLSTRAFEVVGGVTKRRYKIAPGRVHNVQIIDDKVGLLGTLCFAPQGDLAMGDVLVAQKIALESFEEHALRKANFASTIPGAMSGLRGASADFIIVDDPILQAMDRHGLITWDVGPGDQAVTSPPYDPVAGPVPDERRRLQHPPAPEVYFDVAHDRYTTYIPSHTHIDVSGREIVVRAHTRHVPRRTRPPRG